MPHCYWNTEILDTKNETQYQKSNSATRKGENSQKERNIKKRRGVIEDLRILK